MAEIDGKRLATTCCEVNAMERGSGGVGEWLTIINVVNSTFKLSMSRTAELHG